MPKNISQEVLLSEQVGRPPEPEDSFEHPVLFGSSRTDIYMRTPSTVAEVIQLMECQQLPPGKRIADTEDICQTS